MKINIESLDHVAIAASDIKETSNWYVENLNASVEYIDDTWALLDVMGNKLALTTPTQHPPHVAFRVSNIQELGDDYREHRDGSCYIYKSDPSGNVIELIYWRDKDE